jgi:hypothetical protein
MTEQYVPITAFIRPTEAHLVLAHLQEADIAAFLSGELTAGFMGDLSGLGPQVWLHVPRSELKRALDVLSWLNQAAPLPEEWDELPSDGEVWSCAHCGEAIEDELDICPYCDTPRPKH